MKTKSFPLTRNERQSGRSDCCKADRFGELLQDVEHEKNNASYKTQTKEQPRRYAYSLDCLDRVWKVETSNSVRSF